MPLPLIVGVAVRLAIAAAGKIVAKQAATAAAKKAAAAAAKKAAEAAAKKAAAQGVGRQAGTTAARDAAKKAAQKSLDDAAKAARKKGGKGPPNTAGKHKAKRVQKPHKDCGKVSKYKNAPKKIGERNADHVPSGAALKKAAEDQLDKLGLLDTLPEKQITSILNSVYNNATTITIPEDVHKKGRTWGTKNKPHIQGDSKDLKGAFEKDTAAIQKEMDQVDHGCSEKYAEAVEQMRKIDFDQYVKDAVKDHKLVRKGLGLP